MNARMMTSTSVNKYATIPMDHTVASVLMVTSLIVMGFRAEVRNKYLMQIDYNVYFVL